jgi:hypothetical protein
MEGTKRRQRGELRQGDVAPVVSLDVLGGAPYGDRITAKLRSRKCLARVSHGEQRRSVDGARFLLERMTWSLKGIVQRAKRAGELRIVNDRPREEGFERLAATDSRDGIPQIVETWVESPHRPAAAATAAFGVRIIGIDDDDRAAASDVCRSPRAEAELTLLDQRDLVFVVCVPRRGPRTKFRLQEVQAAEVIRTPVAALWGWASRHAVNMRASGWRGKTGI